MSHFPVPFRSSKATKEPPPGTRPAEKKKKKEKKTRGLKVPSGLDWFGGSWRLGMVLHSHYTRSRGSFPMILGGTVPGGGSKGKPKRSNILRVL